MKLGIRFIIYGEKFSPKLFEEKTGMRLSDKEEIGDLITKGPLKGQLNTMGYAHIYPSEKVLDSDLLVAEENDGTEIDPLSDLVETLYGHREKIQILGIESIQLDYFTYTKGDTLLSFHPDVLKMLGELNADLLISCYEDYHE